MQGTIDDIFDIYHLVNEIGSYAGYHTRYILTFTKKFFNNLIPQRLNFHGY